MLPQPIRPRVLAVSSTPMKRFFSHFPALVEADASGNWRASANIIAMACSAVVMVLPSGVFITTTPRVVAERTSTLSTPMPARPTTFRLVATSSSSLVTLVAERIANPSYAPMMARKSAGDSPVLMSTSMPRLRKISTAAGDSLSLIRTLGMIRSWEGSLLGRRERGGDGCGSPVEPRQQGDDVRRLDGRAGPDPQAGRCV